MSRSISILSILFCVCQLMAQEGSSFPVWLGWQQDWTYNHRLNRLGTSAVAENFMTGPELHLSHSAASGVGADSVTFANPYLLIESQRLPVGGKNEEANSPLIYRKKEVQFVVQGKEKDQIVLTDTLEMEGPLTSYFVPFLAGFDLWSAEDADKLQYLEISTFALAGGENQQKIVVQLKMTGACKSLECRPLERLLDYRCTVFVGLVSSTDEKKTPWFFHQSLDWGRSARKDVFKSPRWDQSLDLPTENSFPLIQAFSFELNKSHWFTEFDMCLMPIVEDNKIISYSPIARFSQWKKGMKKFSASRKHSRFSQRKSGAAFFAVRGLWYQGKEVTIKSNIYEGYFYWPGKNKYAGGEEATTKRVIPLD